ncbi:Pin4p [Kluyveromyces lactis]|uniref:KLLA0E19845p n=1 Tax=Kluyveromyces lactis (strain ATCC 8585 / CBS 2359 / DSM 70799 / NBRC 1267 / NRRL Y-1140 / WM37) TaxID=284590 RepID=Q6CMJ0_KLULA|nr:uncharacterized protein KLLA0_E19845g [Kluyveromyces lactis]CAG99936.1 KLLA0E19845p [Kluyveromyces lactis]|eukprot:XP_454849.1 uncharacterized protein KLLA0_E19845g [Kluyveromyces lactis]
MSDDQIQDSSVENEEFSNSSPNSNNVSANIAEELIPTAIVIKNIPFAIKKEQLLEVIAKMDLPLPYAFNYHFDNGVFRGLAFANFTTTEETTTVVQSLNGKEIGGRKLRVEYKKMLPQAERERIEREKREKRGQLEEQHRSMSNISLQSLGATPSSAPPGGPSMASNNSSSQLFNSFMNADSAAPGSVSMGTVPPSPQPSIHHHHSQLSAQNTAASMSMLSMQGLPQMSERFYAPLPAAANLVLPPQQLDFNDPDTLEIYSQLLLFKDREKRYYELAYPIGVSANHKRVINVLCSFLGLIEVYDPSFIIIRRKSLDHATLQTHLQQQGQMDMMQPLQPSSTGGSISRSQSYTSLLQAHASMSHGILSQPNASKNLGNLQGTSTQSAGPVSNASTTATTGSNSTANQPPSPGQPLMQTSSSLHQDNGASLRNQVTTPSIMQNRIPSGFQTNTQQHMTSSSLLRNQGISPPQQQIGINQSNTVRVPSLYQSQPGTPGINENRFAQLTSAQLQQQQSQQQQQPLAPQHTSESIHSNYSVHSIHDYVPGSNNQGYQSGSISASGDMLDDGLTRSLSGLDLGKRHGTSATNSNNLWS